MSKSSAVDSAIHAKQTVREIVLNWKVSGFAYTRPQQFMDLILNTTKQSKGETDIYG
jgi:hypothetical protein